MMTRLKLVIILLQLLIEKKRKKLNITLQKNTVVKHYITHCSGEKKWGHREGLNTFAPFNDCTKCPIKGPNVVL